MSKKGKESRRREYIAFDSHKHYPWVEREQVESGRLVRHQLGHAPGAIRSYLAQCEPGTAVAVEATENCYWIVGEIAQAGLRSLLAHPRLAWAIAASPPACNRFFKRRTCRTLKPNSSAARPHASRPSPQALITPTLGNSLWLNVSISCFMG